jgi:transmembrane protein 222
MSESKIKALDNDLEIANRAYQQVKTADTSKGEHEFEDKHPSRQSSVDKSKAVIDPERARFPYCIVWTPLPLISWFVPFIGHTGIAMSDGVIHDFAGPYFIGVDELAFGETHK